MKRLTRLVLSVGLGLGLLVDRSFADNKTRDAVYKKIDSTRVFDAKKYEKFVVGTANTGNLIHTGYDLDGNGKVDFMFTLHSKSGERMITIDSDEDGLPNIIYQDLNKDLKFENKKVYPKGTTGIIGKIEKEKVFVRGTLDCSPLDTVFTFKGTTIDSYDIDGDGKNEAKAYFGLNNKKAYAFAIDLDKDGVLDYCYIDSNSDGFFDRKLGDIEEIKTFLKNR